MSQETPSRLTSIGDVVEPTPAADQPPSKPADSATQAPAFPITVLGRNAMRYFFLTASGELVNLAAGQLTSAGGLLGLFNGDRDWLSWRTASIFYGV